MDAVYSIFGVIRARSIILYSGLVGAGAGAVVFGGAFDDLGVGIGTRCLIDISVRLGAESSVGCNG